MPTLPRVILLLSMVGAAALVPCQVRPVRAADPPAAATLPFRQRPPELDHRHQFGMALMPGVGYRVIARYQEGQSCLDDSGDDSKWVCTNDVPMFLDFQLGYGISPRLDLLADLRFGLAHDEAEGVDRQFAMAPGLRVWLDRDVRLKFFTTVQLLFDATSQGQARVRDTDFGLRNSNGLMYDALRNIGVYVQFGENIGFVRWFRIELDIGLGVQVRLP
jgi:hypothetical protein